MMNLKTTAGIAVALALFSTAAQAGNGGTRGASGSAPGQQMRAAGGPSAGSHGASSFSPGHRMQELKAQGQGPARGASSLAPGATMKPAR